VAEGGEPPGEVAADVARADDADLHDRTFRFMTDLS
jgi:hypothetical protein